MKNLLLLFSLLISSHLSMAQTADVLYKHIDKSKSEIKKELSNLELVRDWGKGKNLDMENADSDMLKFRFDENDICISVNFMSFNPKPERVKAELNAIYADNWELVKNWKGNNFDNFSFKKNDKILRMKNSADQVYEIGYPEAIKWPQIPE